LPVFPGTPSENPCEQYPYQSTSNMEENETGNSEQAKHSANRLVERNANPNAESAASRAEVTSNPNEPQTTDVCRSQGEPRCNVSDSGATNASSVDQDLNPTPSAAERPDLEPDTVQVVVGRPASARGARLGRSDSLPTTVKFDPKTDATPKMDATPKTDVTPKTYVASLSETTPGGEISREPGAASTFEAMPKCASAPDLEATPSIDTSPVVGMISENEATARFEAAPEVRTNLPAEAENSETSGPRVTPREKKLASQNFEKLVGKMPDLLRKAQAHLQEGKLPILGWGLDQPKVITAENSKLSEINSSEGWIFIGDLHGDYYAWDLLLTILEEQADRKVCFLGDLVDRGPYSAQLFAAILDFAFTYPDRLLWIVGNHDLAIFWQTQTDEETGVFQSIVQPAEFLDWLNPNSELSQVERESRKQWGDLFIAIVSQLPRAVLFGDGLLAAHGGIPLKDLWQDDNLTSVQLLHGAQHLSDFTFNRATNSKFKVGWRTPERRGVNHGLEFGFGDLAEFAGKVAAFFRFERFIRGHDHVAKGYEIPAVYREVQLLTINGFGFDYLDNSLKKYRETIVYGIGKEGYLPEIGQLAVDPDECHDFYSRCLTSNE
jgi:hypothetical protein